MDKTINRQTPPRISVIMSVYNSSEFLRPAIDSILEQTFQDFEFIIINDGSTDKSLEIIKSYPDKRIRLISRQNKGLTASLNEGLQLAKGEFIARQDADDISVPTRFEEELAYLDAHPRVGLVGSNYAHIDTRGKPTGTVTNVFTHPQDLKTCLVLCNQYGHGSIMMRRELALMLHGYDQAVGHVEDYDLWVRMSRIADVANIEKPLYFWRKVETSVSHSRLDEQVDLTFMIRDKAFEHFRSHRREYRPFGIHPSGKDYWARKSTMYRDYAYLARKNDRVMLSVQFMIAAIVCQPFLKRNYEHLVMAVYKPRFDRWRFEFL